MDTKALERFCPWARRELVDAVRRGMEQLAVNEEGREKWPAGSETAGGRALSPEERGERDAAIARIQKAGGDAAFAEQEAYGWFNRLMALRYMEVNDLLPWGGRALSTAEDAFEPPLAVRADALGLSFLDTASWAERASAGDDEGAFRLALVAACRELEPALPGVFGGAATALLPAGLLSRGEHGVINALVRDVPQEIWGSVEALGWAYQFYNSERKAEFLTSKRKAAPEDLAPATQIFTPDWIVRYMVQNTLGRLWMLNNPQSPLQNQMEFYIEPEAEHEDFLRINGPEEITFCDPACGSGHILVYAFDLLAEMYRERGWRERDIPRAILQNNLSGYEIDSRAAQIAQTALCMKCLELDRRWLSRAVAADVRVLEPVELHASAIPGRKALADALAHLAECGSLLSPSAEDVAALEKAREASYATNLLEERGAEAIEEAADACRALARTFSCVVANPPYLGSAKLGPWMGEWIKRNYPDEKADLCFAFINRICGMKAKGGEAGITATNSWMFLSSSEASRVKTLAGNDISSLVQLSVHGFKGIAAQIFAFTLIDKQPDGYRGGYIRLNDFDHHSLQEPKTLEAVQNPGCGWFYRADASTFRDIPGSPIAYWASENAVAAFATSPNFKETASPSAGITTGNNERFIRYWWELPTSRISRGLKSVTDVPESSPWVPCNKGGQFRKWYGNTENVMAFSARSQMKMSAQKGYRPVNLTRQCSPSISWSDITSGINSFRANGEGFLFDHVAISAFPNMDTLYYQLALLNSSVTPTYLSFLSPTLHCNAGDIANLPIIISPQHENVDELSNRCISASQADWDSQETSWDFKRSPLA